MDPRKAAEACGIGYKLYQLYELGIKRNPGLVTLEKIARGFRLEIYELFDPSPMPNSGAKASAESRRTKITIRKRQRKNGKSRN
jgi:transcriptional regulator with XRE-family HTH domain